MHLEQILVRPDQKPHMHLCIWSRLWFGRTRVWFHHHALRPGCGRHRRTGGGIIGRHQPRHRPPPCPRHHCPLCRPLCCPHPHRHPRRHPRCRRRRGALDRGRAATAATAAAPIDLSAAREGVRRWVRSRGACACVPFVHMHLILDELNADDTAAHLPREHTVRGPCAPAYHVPAGIDAPAAPSQRARERCRPASVHPLTVHSYPRR